MSSQFQGGIYFNRGNQVYPFQLQIEFLTSSSDHQLWPLYLDNRMRPKSGRQVNELVLPPLPITLTLNKGSEVAKVCTVPYLEII